MKHVFPIFLMLCSILILNLSFSRNTDAALITKPFGGWIISKKALQIRILENTGFTCTVPGSTIEIRPVNGFSSSYLIPTGVKPNTVYPLNVGQAIKGNYNGIKTPIICVNDESGVTKTVNLNPITAIFGTSQK